MNHISRRARELTFSRARAALMRRGVKGINSRTPYGIVIENVKRITGRSFGDQASEIAQELKLFSELCVSPGLVQRVWKPLQGYEAVLKRHRELAETINR